MLRPGGRLAFATWAVAKRNPWATVFGPVLVERGLLEAPAPGEPGQFALGDAAVIEELVRAAGFDEVSVHEVAVAYRVPSWEEYVRLQSTVSTLLRETLASLDPPARAAVEEAARPRFERFRQSGRLRPPGPRPGDARRLEDRLAERARD